MKNAKKFASDCEFSRRQKQVIFVNLRINGAQCCQPATPRF